MIKPLQDALDAVREAHDDAYSRGYAAGRASITTTLAYGKGLQEGLRRARLAVEAERSNPSVPSHPNCPTGVTPCARLERDYCSLCDPPRDFWVAVRLGRSTRTYYYVTDDPRVGVSAEVIVDAAGERKVGRVEHVRHYRPLLGCTPIKRVLGVMRGC